MKSEDHPDRRDVNLWEDLTPDDVLEHSNTASVWEIWEPLELWVERTFD
jgi:hypothetical protein